MEGGRGGGAPSKVVWILACEPRPESGLDCLVCAIFARKWTRQLLDGDAFWSVTSACGGQKGTTYKDLKDFVAISVRKPLTPALDKELDSPPVVGRQVISEIGKAMSGFRT